VLIDRLDGLITFAAAQLKVTKPEEYKRGLRNDEIVTATQEKAEELFKRHHRETIAALVATRVPLVLARRVGPAHHFSACLPELGLPEWVNIPAPQDDYDDDEVVGWRMERDATPNQLTRLIKHRDEIIRGHEVQRNKYVLLRDTALEKGCEPDRPLRTVFFPDDDKSGSGDDPRVPA
jgi:hypothetical protein